MHTSQAGRGGIAPYHHGDLREELLRVCRNQLRTGGLDAISLRKAAQEIGVSHAAPSRHFTSKHALLTAIAAQGFAEAADELASACRKDFGQQEPELYALMAQPKLVDFSDPEIVKPRAVCFAAMMGAVSRALGADAENVESRTVALWASLHGIVMLTQSGVLEHDHGDGSTPLDPSELVRHIRSGIGRPPVAKTGAGRTDV
jgi:AcrR family transcriptional regulator